MSQVLPVREPGEKPRVIAIGAVADYMTQKFAESPPDLRERLEELAADDLADIHERMIVAETWLEAMGMTEMAGAGARSGFAAGKRRRSPSVRSCRRGLA